MISRRTWTGFDPAAERIADAAMQPGVSVGTAIVLLAGLADGLDAEREAMAEALRYGLRENLGLVGVDPE